MTTQDLRMSLIAIAQAFEAADAAVIGYRLRSLPDLSTPGAFAAWDVALRDAIYHAFGKVADKKLKAERQAWKDALVMAEALGVTLQERVAAMFAAEEARAA